MNRPALVLAAVLVAAGAAIAGLAAWRHVHAPRRPEYLLINETAAHDYDLALRMSLKLAERKSGIENALVLLPSLPHGATLEQVAADLMTRYRIGARRHGRGILYLYAERENLFKVEVSYALEGDLPDLFCRRLEEAAKTYLLSEVPQDFLSELIITTNLRALDARVPDDAMTAPAWAADGFLSGGGGAVVRGYRRTLADYQRAIRALPAADLARFAPAEDAGETVRRYLASLAAGIGDPRLPLLTEGSRVFRAVVPRNEEQQRRVAEAFGAAGAWRLVRAGALGLAVPGPGKSNLPVVVRLGSDGRWYVDEPKAWTYFHRFEDGTDFHVKFADNPFLGALRAAGVPNADRPVFGTHAHAPPPPPYPFALEAAVAAGEAAIRAAPADPARYADLGDLYLFEMNWLTPAVALYEKASALAPGEPAFRWRLVDLYLNTSRADRMLAQLRYLAEHAPDDAQTRTWYRAYRDAYDFRDP